MIGDCPACKEGTMYFTTSKTYASYPPQIETVYNCDRCDHMIIRYTRGKRMEDITMKELEGHWYDGENL